MDHRPPRPDQPYAWDDERLSAYLDGELSAPEQAQLEARLVVDPELRQLVDELRAVRQQLEILPEYRLQATFAEQVLRRAEQEMLLSPLGREAVVASNPNAMTAALPASPTAAVQPVIVPLPNRSTARRWQRGVIWTAVAAAAVLLLMVTNRPRGLDQAPVARHDLPQDAAVETGAAKVNTANTPSDTAKGAAPDSPAQPTGNVDAAQGFGTTPAGRDQQQNQRNGDSDKHAEVVAPNIREQADAQKALRKQAVPDSALAGAGGQGSDPGKIISDVPPVIAESPMIAARKPADAAAPNPEQDQMTRGADIKGLNGTAPGKSLLKNQAAAQPLAMQEKQSGQRRGQLPKELAAFLASDEFSKLGISSDEKNNSTPAEDQLLVVYLTPHAESTGNRLFESLLASNSIELADKSLAPPQQKNRQRSVVAPTPKSTALPPEALAKGSLDKDQAAGAMAPKPSDLRESGKPGTASNGPAPAKETESVLASESTAQVDTTEGNELYYLEAEAGQVEQLLQQLRAAPNRFSRLSVAGRGLPGQADYAKVRDEKNPAPQSAPAAAKFGASSADASVPPAEPAAMPFAATAPAAPGPATPVPSAPAPAATAPAAQSPAAPLPPPAAIQPNKPLPPAADPSPSAVPNDAPAAIVESVPSSAGLFSADLATESPNKNGAGKAGADLEGLAAGAQGGRRALQMEKSLGQAPGDRVVAYRLRGVDSLRRTKNADQREAFQGAAGGLGGGAGQAGKAAFDNAKPSELEKSDTNGQPVSPTKASATGGEQKLDGVASGQAANSGIAALPATPKAEPLVVAPRETAEPEKRQEQQPRPRAETASSADRLPVPGDASARLFTRNEEQITAEEKASAESGKKSAAAPSKRVRVLFVIEHEPTKE